jgi:hypothetical protein
MKLLFTIFLTLAIKLASAQYSEGEMINFYGKITSLNLNDSAEKALDGITVEFWADNELLTSVSTAGKGKYSVNLPFKTTYTVKYGGGKYVQKIIEVNISKFYDEADKKMLKMNVDMALFRNNDYIGLDFMTQLPVAKAEYNSRKKMLVWDEKYHSKMKDRILSVLNAYGY